MTKVAAIQMVSGGDTAANMSRAAVLLAQAKNNGAELVVLPEMFTCIGNRSQAHNAIQYKNQQDSISALAELAKQQQLWLVAGSIPYVDQAVEDLCDNSVANDSAENTAAEKDNATFPKPFARCIVFNSDGAIEASYDKIHLFDALVAEDAVASPQHQKKQKQYRESDYYTAGESIVVIPTPFGRLGLAICYDLRFPELFRIMFQREVDFIALPSAFTAATGKAHWQTLLQARAIENHCYIIAANQGGIHDDGRETFGHSMVVDPWGDIQAQIEDGEGVVNGLIDLSYRQSIRERMPCHAHQKIVLVEKL